MQMPKQDLVLGPLHIPVRVETGEAPPLVMGVVVQQVVERKTVGLN